VHYLLHGPRLEVTTNGTGLISETPSQALDQLDAGSWFAPEFAGERIPRLDEFLRWIKGKAKIFLDLKDADLLVLTSLLRDLEMTSDCFVWSGKDDVLREMGRLAPEIRRKVNVFSVPDVVRADEEFGAEIIEVRLKDMSQRILQECRRRGMQVMIYHERKEEGAYRQILRWGVELVNLNHGDLFLRVLQDVDAERAANRLDGTPLPLAKRAILVMLDGCRGDALDIAQTPTFDRMRTEGAWTLNAKSVMPSVTLPCHTSIFHSQMPDEHGIFSNEWRPAATLAPSMIAVIRDAGYDTAAFYTWEELRDLAPTGKLDRSHYRRLSYAAFDELYVTAIETITRLKPTFSFVYLEAPDALGHLYGWMSPRYLEAVTKTDEVIGLLMEALAAIGELKDTMIMVMADHGGHGRGHGTEIAEDMLVPWLVWGPGICAGHLLQRDVRLIDVAPTLLYALGIPQPNEWRGEIIHEIFEDAG
jgi:glycerophosphoryl diester phosphodiesterase